MTDDQAPQDGRPTEAAPTRAERDSRQVTARTFAVTAAILLILGMVVLSPAAGFLFESLGALMAAVAAIIGRGSRRLAAVLLLVLTLAAANSLYAGFRADMDQYTERANREGG